MSEVEEKLYSDDNIDVHTHKCPNCGGESVFDPKKQKLKCLYCGSEFEIQNNKIIEERNLGELLNEGNVWSEAEVYQCETCGAKSILDKNEVASECPFCGTSNIVKTTELPGLKPQGIVPFKITKEKTLKLASQWAKKKLYAPKAFKKSLKAQNLHGVYNPVFTFDSITRNSYSGRLGKHYTYTRTRNGHVQTYSDTRYFTIKGSLEVPFDDLLIQASSNMPVSMIHEIEPFPTNKALEYKTEYLKGYTANTYNKSGENCWNECKDLMKYKIEQKILKKYNYDVVSYLNVDTYYLNEHYKYVLVPVYVGHYTYKEKNYNFYVNGSNGRVGGKTPVSPIKVGLTVLGILLLIGLIVGMVILFGD